MGPSQRYGGKYNSGTHSGNPPVLSLCNAHRSLVFISLGLSGFVPVFHAVLSPDLALPGHSTAYFVGGAMLYGLGAVFYVHRIPEKHWPDIFDIWVSRHPCFLVSMQANRMSSGWQSSNLPCRYQCWPIVTFVGSKDSITSKFCLDRG